MSAISSSSTFRPARGGGRELLCAEEDMDAELWYTCAGPQHTLPPVSSLVAYFPQGHIEQIASFNNPDVGGYVPRGDLPAAIPCILNDIRLCADPDTDEVFATLTLCPVSDPIGESSKNVEVLVRPQSRSVSFTKTLTVSDTSTHGGFSVPRRGAEDCFPPLDKSQDNPVQDLVAKDLHGAEWKFRHLFRGQPKRHLLTTGWSVFVSQKRLVAGDSVLFLRGEDGQLRIAVRLAPRPQKQSSMCQLTTPTMAIGVLEAAAHAASNLSRFSLIYNPRSCPSQFVIPYGKYLNALKNFSVGQRVKSEFVIPDAKLLNAVKSNPSVRNRTRTRFESDDASECRYTGTIVEISDYDHGRWPGSLWRSLQVNWDEPSDDRQDRISPWEISLLTTRTSLPVQDRTRKRYKTVVQPPMVQLDSAMSLKSRSHFNRPEPLHAFGGRLGPGLPSSGLQDLLGYRMMDRCQTETLDSGVQVYEAYKTSCELGASLPPSSHRPSTFHSFINDEPCSVADLELRVSTPVAKEQASNKFRSSPQPSLAPLRDPSDWMPLYRSIPDALSLPLLSRSNNTALSMSNLPPGAGFSSHRSAPNRNVWESQIQTPASSMQGKRKCRIFGVSLDKPDSPIYSSEVSSAKLASGIDELSSENTRRLENLGMSVDLNVGGMAKV